MHAEETAIQKIAKIKPKILSKATIYIVKLSKCGEYKNPTPCHNCTRILNKYNIKKVICCI